MFNGIHDISIQLLGDLPLGFEIFYAISDFFLLFIIILSFIFIILLPFKLMKGW